MNAPVGPLFRSEVAEARRERIQGEILLAQPEAYLNSLEEGKEPTRDDWQGTEFFRNHEALTNEIAYMLGLELGLSTGPTPPPGYDPGSSNDPADTGDSGDTGGTVGGGSGGSEWDVDHR